MGYIGSFVASTLLGRGDNVHIVDNLSNSFESTLDNIKNACGFKPAFSLVDIRDYEKLNQNLKQFRPDIVVHLAALKSVEESMKYPLDYYDNNVAGLINVLKAMDENRCGKLVFSSSAAVYGSSEILPITEECGVSAQSVYGETKVMGEQLIQDWARSGSSKSAVSLRYFNPVGAHPSAKLGENSKTPASGVMNYICEAASSKRKTFNIFGNDYKTTDGTAERDFIHVIDLATAHQSALDYCVNASGYQVFNIGTGTSVSILQLLSVFESTTKQDISYCYAPRRSGDVPRSFAAVEKARSFLGWSALYNLEEMCRSAWNWSTDKP